MGRSHRDFAIELRDYLMNKYFWRDWVVISYNEIGTYDSHCMNTWVWFRNYGRNLAVASVPEDAPIWGATSTRGWCPVAQRDWWGRIKHNNDRALQLYDSISNRASAKVVVEGGNGLWYETDNGSRVFFKKNFGCHGKLFYVLLFFQ